MKITVLDTAEARPLLEHSTWTPAVLTAARADLAAHGYVFVSSGGDYVPHPSPPFAVEDYPTRVLNWASRQ